LALGCGLRNFMVCQMTIAMTIALSHGWKVEEKEMGRERGRRTSYR
jgi:hypothetical protein